VRSLRDYIDLGGGRAARTARSAPPADTIGVLRASGLRGRGGAGFPTGAKWETVAASRSLRAPTSVVVNAAEGEPGTFKDRALLRTNPYRVLEGAIVAAATMETDRIRIGIKATFGREIDRLTEALGEMRDAGWLQDLDIGLVLGPSSYLFGEETALLEVIDGRQPFPRVTPPYRRGVEHAETRSAVGAPLASLGGGSGAPALVDNVETLANVPLIVEHGAEWFRELGTDGSPGTIVATVSGAARRSAVGEVPMGTTLREVIDLVGWGPRPGHEIRVVLSGTANALIPAELLDTPLTYEAMRAAGSGLGSAGFLVFDETTPPAAVAAGVLRFLSVESCGQCEPCKADGLQLADQLRRSLHRRPSDDERALLRRRISTVVTGARCNLAQQQAAVGASLLELFPDALDVAAPSGTSPAAAPVPIAPIEDLVDGRATLDVAQLAKQPDWSFGPESSGAAPAARLGNTPVHLSRPYRRSTRPEWSADSGAEHPLDIVDDSHAAIDALIDRALADGGEEREDSSDLLRAVAVAVRTHLDVTTRVLFPMLRRVGDDTGDRLADAAEAQERTVLRLLADLDGERSPRTLRDLGVALHDHAAIGEEILGLLRSVLDPVERASLADGLATAQATSTVSRLARSAASVPTVLRPQPEPAVEPAEVQAAVPPVPESDPTTQLQATPAPRVEPLRTATFGEILVGVDGSGAALAALAWAHRLADRAGAGLVVANVLEPEEAELPPEDHPKLVEAAEALLLDWVKPLRGSPVPHRCLQLAGPPDALLAAAASVRARLLVVGTRGAGRRAALHLGSLAHHLAHRTSGPLAIVPLDGAANEVDRIVLGVDGSAGSEAAATWCAGVAAATGASVLVVCAIGPRLRPRTEDEARWREVAETAIAREWVSPLRAAGVAVDTTVVDGARPLDALSAAAAEQGAGLIVVGTRGLSEVGGVRIGRLPLQLVHHLRRPVVLVPPGAR
jgi:NADH:ubiquinone oxidoreductase subunit F (NADH-binding)/nucleotide-binding universal stress UspA family protein